MSEKPDYDKAKQEALKILDNFGYNTPSVNPIKICRELGIRVYFSDFQDEDDKISGFFHAEKNEIYVNKNEYPKRQTFTIAHELGHKILHEDWLISQEYQVLLRDSTAMIKDFREQEADVFAAHLLVPKFLLDRYYKIASIEELSQLFVVSMPVIKNRIQFEYGK